MYISDCICLIQWNCCGIRSKLPQLQHIASEVDIMCLQELLCGHIITLGLMVTKS